MWAYVMKRTSAEQNVGFNTRINFGHLLFLRVFVTLFPGSG